LALLDALSGKKSTTAESIDHAQAFSPYDRLNPDDQNALIAFGSCKTYRWLLVQSGGAKFLQVNAKVYRQRKASL